MNGIIRKHMVFHGDVQGVGLRYRAMHAAEYEGVTGWVRNEYDGSVSMEAQGTEERIARMVQRIGQGSFVEIHSIDEEIIPLMEDEKGFRLEW